MGRISEYEAQNNSINRQIDIFEFIMIVLKGWKLVLLAIAVTFFISLGFIVKRPILYEANAKLIVSGNTSYYGRMFDESDLSFNQKLVTTYAEVATSRTVMRDVISKLELDIQAGKLSKNVRVETVKDTEFINIYYKDTDPQRAALILNEVSKAFIVHIKNLMRFDNLKIVENAEVPKNPTGIGNKLIAVASVLLGAFIGANVVLFVEIFHSNLKKPEDIEKIMECPVIGTIPAEEAIELEKYSRKRK